jgi:hypothetical protein
MDSTAEQGKTAGGPPDTKQQVRHRGSITGGLILIVLGGIFLMQNFIPDVRIGDYWPLLLIAIGIGLLWKSWKTS